MITPGTYRVVAIADERIHRAQGGGQPAVGDIITVGNLVSDIWRNHSGEWCWGIKRGDNEYGAAFHSSHIEPAAA